MTALVLQDNLSVTSVASQENNMFYNLFKFYYFLALTCMLLLSSFCKGDFENDEFFRNILNERLEKSGMETGHESRRQLNFGSENSEGSGDNWSEEDEITQSHNVTSEIPPEAWTGRWFPAKVAESPHHIPTEINSQDSGDSLSEEDEVTQSHNVTSEIPPEAWPGRWFPAKIAESPHHIPTEIKSQDSGDSLSEEDEITQSHNVTSEIPPEAWPGRWFPAKIADPTHHIPTEINSQDSGASMSEEDEVTQSHNVTSEIPPEAWPGRWFPAKIADSTHHVPTKINSQDSGESLSEEDEVTQSHNVTSEIPPEAWPGRWFPAKIADSTHHIPTEISTEAWTGRWFPDKVPQSPHHIPIEIAPERWPGRWFPEKVTESTHHIPSEIPSQIWTGKWFPSHRPNTFPGIHFNKNEVPYENSMWRMINSSCDDGKTNLTVDWNGSPINYTCLNPHQYFLPDYDIPSIIIKSLIPEAYMARHECMKNEIHYTSDLPTFGTHRPAWPKYGEYQFVPKQRWIHSLEHGAIVMLYHPCAHPQLVHELRELVTLCLYRHVITPYTLLPHDRPFALLSWGWALLMSAPEENTVKTFIIDHAKKGPEALSMDGQFSEGLLRPAAIVSDIEDSRLCPRPELF